MDNKKHSRIVDYRKDPERFGPALARIAAECYAQIGERLSREPELGVIEWGGDTVASSADYYKKTADLLFRKPESCIKYYEENMTRGGRTFIALDRSGNVAGGTHVRPEYVGSSRFAYMGGLFVDAGYRENGLGSALTRVREDFASGLGLKRAFLYPLIYLPTFQHHLKNGYIPERVFRGKREIRMIKDLTE